MPASKNSNSGSALKSQSQAKKSSIVAKTAVEKKKALRRAATKRRRADSSEISDEEAVSQAAAISPRSSKWANKPRPKPKPKRALTVEQESESEVRQLGLRNRKVPIIPLDEDEAEALREDAWGDKMNLDEDAYASDVSVRKRASNRQDNSASDDKADPRSREGETQSADDNEEQVMESFHVDDMEDEPRGDGPFQGPDLISDGGLKIVDKAPTYLPSPAPSLRASSTRPKLPVDLSKASQFDQPYRWTLIHPGLTGNNRAVNPGMKDGFVPITVSLSSHRPFRSDLRQSPCSLLTISRRWDWR